MRELKKELWPYNMRVRLAEDIRNNTEESMESWLNTEIGAYRDRWNAVYHMTNTVYYFRNSRDVVMFALRWGG